MLRLLVVLGVLGLMIVLIVEIVRHNRATRAMDELEERERYLALDRERIERETKLRRAESTLEAEEKFSEVDDIFSTIKLNEKRKNKIL